LSNVATSVAIAAASVEGTLKDWQGFAGLSLIHSVLAGGKSVEKIARDLGACSKRELRSWAWLFRKCLDVLAKRSALRITPSGRAELEEPRTTARLTRTSLACTPTTPIWPVHGCAPEKWKDCLEGPTIAQPNPVVRDWS
jgi:hypothetical protein